jgi:cytochrome c5
MKIVIVTVASLVLILAACKTTKPTETKVVTAPTPVTKSASAVNCSSYSSLTFAADIKPILEKQCISCHSEGGSGGYDFTVVTDVKKAGQNGALLGTIKWQNGYPAMPAGYGAEKMDAVSIAKIECWLNNGMK